MGNAVGSARFDVTKLDEWLELFEYMQSNGVVPHLVLEDDGGWTGFDRYRYYRELVARFGHLPAVVFNLAEAYQENYSLTSALAFLQQFADLDPYDHPLGIHNVNDPSDEYIDAAHISMSSIHTTSSDPLRHNDWAIDWIETSTARGVRVVMVSFDEPAPRLDRQGWWSGYIGGAVWEAHVTKPYDAPMSSWEPAWTELGGARTFMESLPFWEMDPRNLLVVDGDASCLAKEGEAYALYLPDGGTIEVLLDPGTYSFGWWNPENDANGLLESNGTTDGGQQQFTAPGTGDWVLRIVREP